MSAQLSERQNIHATGLVLGETGIVLRGPSGSGKSLLALELLDEWETRRLPARLVADDRIEVSEDEASLFMHPPKPIEGLIELRGRGIVRRPFAERAEIHLVVDLVDELVRMLEESELLTDLLGHTLPRCPVPKRGIVDSGHQRLLVREALREIADRKAAARQKTT